ncbi:transposase ISC1190 [Sulfolobus islandicus L.S.2.15]|uniref:Transposase ISC1190 n=1 Tax=Saccharolobus islandicus (strain L.S.2.15 / Lassen \|nr:transposase ISC1190 [Sulfolobus islandicus L.S.2.15]
MEAPVAEINISKDKLVVYFQGGFYELPNNRQGFEKIRQTLSKGCKVGIESTRVYHVNLDKRLMGEYDVMIINPLRISSTSRFS